MLESVAGFADSADIAGPSALQRCRDQTCLRYISESSMLFSSITIDVFTLSLCCGTLDCPARALCAGLLILESRCGVSPPQAPLEDPVIVRHFSGGTAVGGSYSAWAAASECP